MVCLAEDLSRWPYNPAGSSLAATLPSSCPSSICHLALVYSMPWRSPFHHESMNRAHSEALPPIIQGQTQDLAVPASLVRRSSAQGALHELPHEVSTSISNSHNLYHIRPVWMHLLGSTLKCQSCEMYYAIDAVCTHEVVAQLVAKHSCTVSNVIAAQLFAWSFGSSSKFGPQEQRCRSSLHGYHEPLQKCRS